MHVIDIPYVTLRMRGKHIRRHLTSPRYSLQQGVSQSGRGAEFGTTPAGGRKTEHSTNTIYICFICIVAININVNKIVNCFVVIFNSEIALWNVELALQPGADWPSGEPGEFPVAWQPIWPAALHLFIFL